MRRYKIFARILLMLSVIDFALTAPVVVQEHEVRISVTDAAIGRTATPPLRRDPSDKWPADRTNAPWIPRSSDLGHWREHAPGQYNLRSRTHSDGSPEPSDLARPYYTPSPSPPWGPWSPSRSPSPDLSNPSSKMKSLSELMLMPTLDTPPDGSPQTESPQHHVSPLAGSPTSPPDLLNPSSKMKSLSELMSTPTHDAPPPDGSPQIASSPDKSYSPGTKLKSLSELMSTPTHDASPPNLGNDLPSDNHPLSTSPSNPGPSTERNPPPSTKRPRPEEPETWRSSFRKLFKGKLKRRFSCS